ncbi:nucleotidyltransferase domain-containing protein [Candidatus Geothermarchaeota archaeon]|nr:MAG: nucleotidyltransferase domain-containing protein [Candidatus Geothermarchaeota archaeon]
MSQRIKYFRLDRQRKNEIIATISGYLKDVDDVILAIIFGSFIELESFRDIDIAIYAPNVDIGKIIWYSAELELTLNIPVDIIHLNIIPTTFKYYVLTKGLVIYEKYPGIYEALLNQVIDEKYLLNQIR